MKVVDIKVYVNLTGSWCSCHVRISCCTAIKSSSNTQRSIRNASVLSVEEPGMFLEVGSISSVWLGHGQHYPNFLLIRMVRNFPLPKGVRKSIDKCMLLTTGTLIKHAPNLRKSSYVCVDINKCLPRAL